MTRLLIKAACFSIVINLLYFVIYPVLSGLFLSYFYTPEIKASYENVDFLQNEVAFGVILRPDSEWLFLLPFLAGMLLYGLLELGVRSLRKKATKGG